MQKSVTQSMVFNNTTSLPISIYSWIGDKYGGSSTHKGVIIPANTVKIVYSDTGEWILSSEFFDKENNDAWNKEGLEQFYRIAKFQNEPYFTTGSYTFNFIEESFDIDHKDGIIIWSRIPDKKKERNEAIDKIMKMSFFEFIFRVNTKTMPDFVRINELENDDEYYKLPRMTAYPNPSIENQTIMDTLLFDRETNGKTEQWGYEMRYHLKFKTLDEFVKLYFI
jgi:hypothetical protein